MFTTRGSVQKLMADDGPLGFPRNRRLWLELLHQAVVLGGLFWSLRLCLKYLDPYKESREQARKRAAFLKSYLGRAVELNEYEQLLAANVMNPSLIDVNLEDVNGLDDVVEELERKLLFPLTQPDLYCTTLFKPTRGILLYGPPGTGKTMLAKALAKQSGCFFLNITASSILSKYYGDANRLVRAIFTLADKLQPCIIFIDEVDALLGKRGLQAEHEASAQVKTELMQQWDGMESAKGQRVVVMGCTNRPWQLDEAVLRRFTIQFEIGLPNKAQRASILHGYIKKHCAEVGNGGVTMELMLNLPGPDGVGAIDWIATRTAGFSGSDLHELCAQAAQRTLTDYWQQQRTAAAASSNEDEGASSSTSGAKAMAATSAGANGSTKRVLKLRPLCCEDFEEVLRVTKPSTQQAQEYGRNWHASQSAAPGAMNGSSMAALMEAYLQGFLQRQKPKEEANGLSDHD